MKPILSILLFTFCLAFAAQCPAGTAVGNFNYKEQIEFDFRVGYPPSWTWERKTSTDPHELERWLLSNNAKVSDPAHVSSATMSFLISFPASNDEELLKAITSLHPGLTWQPIQNPDFTVGFYSNQVIVAPSRTERFEYYFSAKHKVVRVDEFRDAVANGAAELDTILSTIRRPSGSPHLISVSQLSPSADTPVKVEDTVCYRLEVDLLRNDFSAASLTDFEVNGALPHWSFKTVEWNKSDSSLKVCMRVNSRFGVDGLTITSLSLAGGNATSLSCSSVGPVDGASQLSCSDPASGLLSYKVSKVNNSNPNNKAPLIQEFSLGSAPNSLHIVAQDPLALAVGQITLDSAQTANGRDSQVIYSDELKSSSFDVKIDPERLSPGFTRIMELMLTDQAGNAVKLKARPGDATYSLYASDSPNQFSATRFPIISVQGVAK